MEKANTAEMNVIVGDEGLTATAYVWAATKSMYTGSKEKVRGVEHREPSRLRQRVETGELELTVWCGTRWSLADVT